MEHQQQATDEGREGAQTEVKEEEGRPTSRIALDAITKAEEFLTSYEVMLGGQGDGAPAMVSAPQAQNTLHSAQQALEPFLACVRASPAPPSSDAASMPLAEDVLSRIKAALFRAYEQEASLLRQLAKVEQSVKNRFLFLHQSSVVSEKALELYADDVQVLNMLALNSFAQACLVKPSPEQDQYFQKSYDSYKKVAELTDGKTDQQQKELHMLAIGNWANTLEEQAERKKGTEADALFQQSIAKYKEYIRKAAPSHACKMILGMAVAMQAQARNLEADGDSSRQAKRIDLLHSAAADAYLDIISHKKAKYNNRYRPNNTLLGAINNYTMVLMNQARHRALFEKQFAPFPESCLSLLKECKRIMHIVLLESNDQLAEFSDMLNQRMQEVDAFETTIVFTSRMAQAQKHTAGI